MHVLSSVRKTGFGAVSGSDIRGGGVLWDTPPKDGYSHKSVAVGYIGAHHHRNKIEYIRKPFGGTWLELD
jgi:hypothetical protein